MAKKSNEQFLKDFHDKFGNEYEIIGEYESATSKINIMHKPCGAVYARTPNAILDSSCKYICIPCRKNDDFLHKILELAGEEYTVLDKYSNAETKMRFLHNTCGMISLITPHSFIGKGVRCKHCNIVNRKSNQDFLTDLKNAVGDEYEALEEYNGWDKKILFKHRICENEFRMSPNSIVNVGTGCPYCRKNRRLTNDEFLEKLKLEVGEDFIPLEEYKGASTHIDILHTKCGEILHLSPYEILKCGYRCKYCLGRKLNAKTVVKRIHEILGDEYIFFDDTYVETHKKAKMKHLACGTEYYVRPANIFKESSGCPVCRESKGEKEVRKYLVSKSMIFTAQMKFDGLLGIKNGELSYDFYIPDYDLLIEYQGQYHDGSLVNKGQTQEDFESQKEHDRRKREYAKSHDMDLLEIWYYDFDRISEILDEYFGNKLAA